MSRSGAKETTLDYTRAFAERRGLAEEFGVGSEIAVGFSTGRIEERADYSSEGERVGTAADRPPSVNIEVQRSGRGVESGAKKVEPLVPALKKHSRSIEDVAREKARPDFERAMEAVRSFGRNVYTDHDGVCRQGQHCHHGQGHRRTGAGKIGCRASGAGRGIAWQVRAPG